MKSDASQRDIDGIKNCLETLKGYVQLCQIGRLEFAMDIPTQIYKLLFDETWHNQKTALLKRVENAEMLIFHPLMIDIPANRYLSHSPAGYHYFDTKSIRIDLFDLSRTPISLNDWQKQIIMVAKNIDLSIYDFVRVLRDKETAHFDPGFANDSKNTAEMNKLEAAKSIIYTEYDTETRQQKILIALGDYVYRRVEEIVFPSAKSLSEWGFRLIEQKRYDDAIEMFRKASILDKLSSEALYGWGHALLQTNRFDEAINRFESSIEKNPSYDPAYHGWGIALGYKGDTKKSEEKFKKAVQVNPLYSDAWYNWGVNLIQQKQYKKAISKFKKAIKINSSFTQGYHSMGLALGYIHNYTDALDSLKMAVASDPNYAEAWFDLALLLEKLGYTDDAGEKFHIARSLGCSRSFQLSGAYSTVVLTRYTGSGESGDSRRPLISDHYRINWSDFTGIPSWPKSTECPYYGLLVGVEADRSTIKRILNDKQFVVIYSDRLLDPDIKPQKEFLREIKSWFTSEGMSYLDASKLFDNFADTARWEIAEKLNEILLNTRKAPNS